MLPEGSESGLTLKIYMHMNKGTISTFQIFSKKTVSVNQIWDNNKDVSMCQIMNQILQ